MKLELVDPIDWDFIEGQLDRDFGRGTTRALLGDLAPVMLMRNDNKSFYLIPFDWIKKIEQEFVGFDVKSLGLWFGEIIDEKFRLSLPILEKLAKITKNKLIVSSRGAEAFTYGRSILKESVAHMHPDLKRGERVIVFNENNDVLGMAMLSVNAFLVDRLAKDKLVGKNLVDIGWYLRRMA